MQFLREVSHRMKLIGAAPGAQAGGTAAEELSRQRPVNLASMALVPDLQLHVGRGHGTHAIVVGGGSTVHEV